MPGCISVLLELSDTAQNLLVNLIVARYAKPAVPLFRDFAHKAGTSYSSSEPWIIPGNVVLLANEGHHILVTFRFELVPYRCFFGEDRPHHCPSM